MSHTRRNAGRAARVCALALRRAGTLALVAAVVAACRGTGDTGADLGAVTAQSDPDARPNGRSMIDDKPAPRPARQRQAAGGASREPEADDAGAATERIPDDAEAPDVFLIVVDTMRADVTSLFSGGFDVTPFLAELAKKGVVYERAYSTSSWTVPAMYSVMTGLFPSQHGMKAGEAWGRRITEQPILSGRAYTLAEQMRDMGYTTFAVSTNQHLGAKFGMDQGFDRFVGDAFSKLPFPEVALEALLPEIRASKRRFVWLHYFDPHHPYGAVQPWFDELNDSGLPDYSALAFDALSRYFRARRHIPEGRPLPLDAIGPIFERSMALRIAAPSVYFMARKGEHTPPPPGTPEDRYLRFLEAAYASEVRAADESIRHMYERLGIGDEDLVIVLSDHGEELMEHGRVGHRFFGSVSEELVHVPLLIKYPHNRGAGRRIASSVSLVDILPTIRAALGQRPIERLTGRDLAVGHGGEGEPGRLVFGELSEPKAELRFAVDYPWKLIRDARDSSYRLYDLAHDPEESEDLSADLSASNRAARGRLERALEAFEKEDVPAWNMGRTARLTADEIERLKAMGYVE